MRSSASVWLVVCLAVAGAASGCDRGSGADVIRGLPACEHACVVSARGNPLLGISEAGYRVWGGEAQVPLQRYEGASLNEALAALELELKAGIKSGLPIVQTGFVLCQAQTPGATFTELLRHSATRDWKAVALGGRGESSTGYVALGVWRDEALKRVEVLERGTGVEALLKKIGACATGAPCPLLAVRPDAFTCGELVRLADQLSQKGRLLGLAM